ncbi:hypothetical protein WJX77_010505 [Trebouxia sp. C0004]
MSREKRRLPTEDAVGVEATCRAVKRLQIAATDIANSCGQGVPPAVWPVGQQTPTETLQQLPCQLASSSSVSSLEQHDAAPCQDISVTWDIPSADAAESASPTRYAPHRSMSSPDMSRFKFRLTSCKPPIHPESTSKLLRQQSAAEHQLQTADDSAVLKSTTDRHCDQERLFHQLDQKLTLHAPQQQPLSPSQNQRSPPFPSCASMLTSFANLGPPQVATAVAATSGNAVVNGQDIECMEGMAHDELHVMVDNSNSGELCSPSTPIRREDSLPVREQKEQAAAEVMFAAMYEQTNILLRNLHFERLNRRATSA